MRRLLVLGLALVVVATLVGCGPSTLQQIQRDPQSFKGKEVTVKGKVGRLTPIGGKNAYTLNDGKAEILVMPKSDAPKKGSKVTLTVVVETDYSVEGTKQPVVLVEK